jgi:hypothetical protein
MRKSLLRVLPVSVGRFMSMRVMHGLAMELSPMVDWVLATPRRRPVVALAIVKMVVYVAIEVIRPMKPRTSPDKYATGEPFRTVITIRRAGIRGFFVIAVGANRRSTNFHRHLSGCGSARTGHKKQASSKS